MIDTNIYADKCTVKRQAKKAAVQQVRHSLDELIHPSDVQEGAEEWEDIDEETLHQEVGRGLSVMREENQVPAIRDLAIVLWRESLPRVPMDDLIFDDRETAVRNGYWPYRMDRVEVTGILWEYADDYEHFHECLDEAESELGPVMYDAYHPLKEPDV